MISLLVSPYGNAKSVGISPSSFKKILFYYLNKISLPFVFFINKTVNLIIRKKDKKDLIISDEQSEEELQGVIDLYKTSNPDSEHEKEMLQSILKLNDTICSQIDSINDGNNLSLIYYIINLELEYVSDLNRKTL